MEKTSIPNPFKSLGCIKCHSSSSPSPVKSPSNSFLFGGFNLDLIKSDRHAGTNEFIDLFSSYTFLLYISHPTRVTGYLQTITHNIFSMFQKRQCSNLTSTISDYFPQVLFIPSIFSDHPATKSNIFERSWSNFNQAEFVMDYFDKD